MNTLVFPLCIGLVLTLCHCAAPSGGGNGSKAALATATKELPFVNSLGMKFVPVPGTNILMCTTETTLAQYQQSGRSYQAPTFPQGSNHPAVNVSWNDAVAYCKWLSKRDGHTYRLPTDTEWSAAVGGSTYPWGNSWPPPNNIGNYAGQELRNCTSSERALFHKGYELIGGFSDRHKFTAPVGSYPSNGYGLYDLGGNVWEWCGDKHPTLSGDRVLRGGSLDTGHRDFVASSRRYGSTPDFRRCYNGFRCVVVR